MNCQYMTIYESPLYWQAVTGKWERPLDVKELLPVPCAQEAVALRLLSSVSRRQQECCQRKPTHSRGPEADPDLSRRREVPSREGSQGSATQPSGESLELAPDQSP